MQWQHYYPVFQNKQYHTMVRKSSIVYDIVGAMEGASYCSDVH